MSDSLWPPWTVTCQAPLSMGLSRQEHLTRILAKEWAAVSSGDLPNPGIEPWSPALQADSLLSEPPEIWLPFFFFFFASFGGAENEQWYLVPGSVKHKYRNGHFFISSWWLHCHFCWDLNMSCFKSRSFKYPSLATLVGWSGVRAKQSANINKLKSYSVYKESRKQVGGL